MPQVINVLARSLVYVVLGLAMALPTVTPAASATPGTGAAYTGAAWGAGAMQPVALEDLQADSQCDTDYQCALVELGQAMVRGEVVSEDLTFPSASGLYGAKNELIADRFWAEFDGMDWDGAKYFLGGWVDRELGTA